MVASILIIVFSVALLVYWFRYTCILLVRSEEHPVASVLPSEGQFQIAEVQARLRDGAPLDPLHAALQRDYSILMYLLDHAPGIELESFEERLLLIDVKMMQWWYRLTRTAAPDKAREALGEIAAVLGILAGRMSERARLNSPA